MELEATRIPNGWSRTSLESVCQILDFRRIPLNNSERSQRIIGRSADDLYPYYGATGQVGVIDDFIFEGEHILLGEDGAPFLDPFKVKSYLVDGKFWVNNHAHILKSAVPNKFLCHYLNQIDYSDYVTGTTRMKLTQNALKRIPVFVAPIAEQRRIVAKIEELFSELDKGVENLKTARAKLHVYRQAILKHAFEGKLTAQWREENKDKLEKPEQLLARIKQEREARYQRQLREWETAVKKWEQNGKEGKKPVKPRKLSAKYGQIVELADSSERDIPHGWYETIFGEVIRNISINHKKLPKTLYSETGTFPVIDQGQKIVDGYCNELDRVVDEDLPLIVFGDHTRIIKFINRPFVPGADGVKVFKGLGVDDKWLFYIAHALDFPDKGYARHFQHLKKARLLVPSLTEQRCIVAEVEEKLSVLEDLYKTLDHQLIMADALRQSILKKAFAGQLVPQDPHDEPVSILLGRIRAERERVMKKNHTRKSKKRKIAV